MANSKWSEQFIGSSSLIKPKEPFTKATTPNDTKKSPSSPAAPASKPEYGSVAWLNDKNSHTDHHW